MNPASKGPSSTRGINSIFIASILLGMSVDVYEGFIISVFILRRYFGEKSVY
jgi:hypothetical protein